MKRLITAIFALGALVVTAQNNKPGKQQSAQPKERAVGIKETYGSGQNQWLNIYPAKTGKPAPVYIWSHTNSDGRVLPSANDIPKGVVDSCNEAGIHVISWESVPQVKDREDILTCRADMVNVYKWVAANASKYNIDLDNIFIGGQSRGSIVSWEFFCNDYDKVRGAYLAQALPKGAWYEDASNPLTTMTANNPPLVLSYRTDMETDDGHSPKFGKRIADKYAELGIGDRATLLLEQKNLYTELVPFINKYKKQ